MVTISPEQLLAALSWRYAVKRFDPSKRIEPKLWAALEDSLVLTPSSIGLQPWRFVVVTDGALKDKLRPAAYGQAQVTDCSHFVVMAVRRNLDGEHVDKHVARMSEVRGIPVESLAKFRSMATGNLDKARQENRLDTWQTYQIYIALGNFMTAAALVGVDTCPMEGFDPVRMDELLGLSAAGYASVVCCAAGHRHAEDKYAAIPKVRFAKDSLFVRH